MKKTADYYRILQVHYDAGQEIIDAAYRRLSRMHHPDVNRSPFAAEKMKTINIAYEVLGNASKRRDYHSEWLKTAATGNRFEMKQKNWEPPSDPAFDVLDAYFRDLANEQWEDAYAKLTLADQAKIPLSDFVEWKKAVAEIYRIGTYSIKYFRTFDDCEYADVSYCEIRQFSVNVSEMQVLSGRINEDNTQKYVAMDGGSFRVCLGYTDLKPIILRFRQLARNMSKVDTEEVLANAVIQIDAQTGLLSRTGFLNQTARETARTRRYSNPLSLAMIRIQISRDLNDEFADEYYSRCLVSIADILRTNVRETDIIGKWDDTIFCVLFTETDLESGNIALNKLIELILNDGQSGFETYAGIGAVSGGPIEETAGRVLDGAARRYMALKPDEWTEGPKVGKYNLNDILGFNRPRMPRL